MMFFGRDVLAAVAPGAMNRDAMVNLERIMRQIDPKTQQQLVTGLGMAFGVGAGLAGYSLLHEPLNVHLEQLTIRLPQAQSSLPKRGLRILHLSDTHFRGIAWRENAKIERIRRLTAGLEYDLLVHTGDFWHEETGLWNLLALLDALPPPRLGAFGVLGNHDHVCYSHGEMLMHNWDHYQQHYAKTHTNAHTNGDNGRHRSWLANLRDFVDFARYFLNQPFVLKRTHFNNKMLLRQALAERGVELLNNRSVHLHCNEPDEQVDLYVAGVDDLQEGWPDLKQALAAIPPHKLTILLSHNPDILGDPAVQQADVVLAGHTHGGQIVLPLVGAIHTQSGHLARHEASGHLQRGKTQLYVTRGVGEGIPLRFGARPQITLITLTAYDDE